MAIVNECVGLDIGQTGLKAVRFRRRLSGRETIDYFQHPMPFSRPEDLDPARRVKSLRGFLWQNGLYGTDRLVTAIPCQDLFVRTLSFPFKDSTKLAQVVPFEVENLVPMPLEDLAVGSLVLPPGHTAEGSPRETKGSEVLVTAAPKDKVAEHLRFLAQADVEPSAINVDAMALFSVTQYLQEEGAAVPQDLAIIDVGASKTTLCLVQGGRPLVLRTILWGGNHLTHALAVRHACSFAEAERRKRTMAVDQVDSLLEPILRELRITLQSHLGNERGRFTHCWVCGGGASCKRSASISPANWGSIRWDLGKGSELKPHEPFPSRSAWRFTQRSSGRDGDSRRLPWNSLSISKAWLTPPRRTAAQPNRTAAWRSPQV